MPFLRAALIQKKDEEREPVNILPPIVVVPEEPEIDTVSEEIEILPEPEDLPEIEQVPEEPEILPEIEQSAELQEVLPETEQVAELQEALPETEQVAEVPEDLPETEQVAEVPEDLPEIEQSAELQEALPEVEQSAELQEALPEVEQSAELQEVSPETEQVAEIPEDLPESEPEIEPEPVQEEITDSPDDLGQVPQDNSDAFANLPAEILAAVTEDEPAPEPEPKPATPSKDYSGETLNYDFTSGERYVDKVSTKTEFDKMLDELSAISKDLLSREVEKFAMKFTSKFQGDFDKAEADAKKYEAFLGGFITNAAMTLYENGYRDSAVKQLEQAKGIIEASRRLEEETQAIRDRVEEEDASVDLSDILGLFGD